MHPLIKLIIRENIEKYYTVNKVENQHDKLFKDLLNDKEELKEFLYDYLKIDISKKEIEKCSNSYISGKYKMFEADIVYKIKSENTYILIEHQSSIDKRMPHRMLNYAIEILDQEIDFKKERNKDYKYPMIIPIVLYTGEKEWKVERKFSERIDNNEYKEKYIEMKYELVDINNFNEEELLKNDTAISYAMLIEKKRGKDSLINILNKIEKNCNNKKIIKKIQKIIQYLLSPILGDDTEKMLEKFNIKEECTMKTAQDYVREEMAAIRKTAMEEGREEGRREAREEKFSIILNMIKGKMKIEDIKRYTGVNEEEIQKIAASM